MSGTSETSIWEWAAATAANAKVTKVFIIIIIEGLNISDMKFDLNEYLPLIGYNKGYGFFDTLNARRLNMN